ncbi:FHA domain-containing protein [Candidatus Shapirobacteria bacterium]|nr:FHA domain-containing protein [Candidatus Shapirobacteria bacterium]
MVSQEAGEEELDRIIASCETIDKLENILNNLKPYERLLGGNSEVHHGLELGFPGGTDAIAGVEPGGVGNLGYPRLIACEVDNGPILLGSDGTRIPLQENEDGTWSLTMGREESNQLVFNSSLRGISRHHAKISYSKQKGGFWVTDMSGATRYGHGTYFRRISSGVAKRWQELAYRAPPKTCDVVCRLQM